MISEIANFLEENRRELGLPDERGRALKFFKIGGNPWGEGRINFLAFDEDETEPALFIKTMRDRNKNKSLRHEYEIITTLATYDKLVPFLPLPIHMVNLSDRDVMIQKACLGMRMLSTLSKSPFLFSQKSSIENHFGYAMRFVVLLNNCRKDHINGEAFRERFVEPIMKFYSRYNHSTKRKSALLKLLDRIGQEMENGLACTTLHGDYSATNIFLDSGNQIKIIDWETATENGLPFMDFFYFMSKYIHNLKIMPKNRWQRVESAYFGKGWLSKVIGKMVKEYCQQTGYGVDLARFVLPLHFLNKARIKYAMRGKAGAQPWMELFEFSVRHLDKLRF